MYTVSLEELFTENEQLLRSQFVNLLFPRDKEVLSTLLNDLFDKHLKIGTITENLSAPDLALFQSALQVVESSLGIPSDAFVPLFDSSSNIDDSNSHKYNGQNKTNLIYSTPKQWAVVGATAATVLASLKPNFITILIGIVGMGVNWALMGSTKTEKVKDKEINECSFSVDTDVIMSSIKMICARIDRLMSIYSTNLSNAVSIVESKPKSSLLSNYGYLFDRFSDLFAAVINNEQDKKEDAITDLFKTLKNYHYEFINYSEINKEFFEIIKTDAVSKIELVSPAIVDKGECIMLGKVFVPES